MATVEVLDDCRSEILRQLIIEHNKAVVFMEAVKQALPNNEFPELPRSISVKRRG